MFDSMYQGLDWLFRESETEGMRWEAGMKWYSSINPRITVEPIVLDGCQVFRVMDGAYFVANVSSVTRLRQQLGDEIYASLVEKR